MKLFDGYVATKKVANTQSAGMFSTPPDPETTGEIAFTSMYDFNGRDMGTKVGDVIYFKTDRYPIREGGVEYFIMPITNILGFAD